MEVIKDNDRIIFRDIAEGILGQTEYVEGLWQIVSQVTWSIKRKSNGTPQYLYSWKLRKTLHQVVIDFYFGEDVRRQAYSQNMIIEHLNNNGFDCRISNLYFLLDVKNTYKGNYYDKFRKQSIPIAAMNIYHNILNKTFQVIILFNECFADSEGNCISSLKMLYSKEYAIVLQDAESMLEEIVNKKHFNIKEFKEKYRFDKHEIEYFTLVGSENGSKPMPGECVMINGEPYLVIGHEGDRICHMIETPFDKDWE